MTEVNITEVLTWLTAIPYSEWPSGRDGPAMVHDPGWHRFGQVTQGVIDEARIGHSGSVIWRLLSVVMPGKTIQRHRDEQSSNWRARCHIPLLSNPWSWFLIKGEAHHMTPGYTYWINPQEEHAIVNMGETPRVHLIFDLGS